MQFLVVLLHPVTVSRRVAEYLWAREYQREVEFPSEPECLMRLLRDAVSVGTQGLVSEQVLEIWVALFHPAVGWRRAVVYL